MREVAPFFDCRQMSWCVHCGGSLAQGVISRDHVPSRTLLDRPLPLHVPKVEVCSDCNNGFSKDEEYLAVLLSCMLAGTADPERQGNAAVARALARRPSLRARLEAAWTFDDDGAVLWHPEWERLNRVILKNARGHAAYEMGEPMFEEPEYVHAGPLAVLDEGPRATFAEAGGKAWPKVANGTMTRTGTGEKVDIGWVVVQEGVYRYAVVQDGGVIVRSVLRNFLATETRWS